MQMQIRPPMIDNLKLSINMEQWDGEKKLHLSDQYFTKRAELINRTSDGGQKLACCSFCGFPDGKFLELHHIDGKHDNYQDDNLTLACSLCHKLHHLGWVGMYNLGRLVYMPESAEGKNKTAGRRLAFLNLYQFIRLLDTEKTQEEREVFANLPLSDVFATARQTTTSFGYSDIQQKTDDYIVLRDALQEDKRKYNALKQSGDTEKLDEVEAKGNAKQQAPGSLESSSPNGDTASASDSTQTDEDRADFAFIASSHQLTKYEEELAARQKMETAAYVATSLHLLDFVESMAKSSANLTKGDNSQNALEKFTDKQNKSLGLFAIEFNMQILKPWDKRLGYSLKDRIAHYENLGLLRITQFTKDDLTQLAKNQHSKYVLKGIAEQKDIAVVAPPTAMDNMASRLKLAEFEEIGKDCIALAYNPILTRQAGD